MKLAFWAVRLATRTVSETKFKVLVRIAFACLFLKEIKTHDDIQHDIYNVLSSKHLKFFCKWRISFFLNDAMFLA